MTDSRSTDKVVPIKTEEKVGHVALACYLWFKGYKLLRTEWTDGLCKWFFEKSDDIRPDIDAFFDNACVVDPREFFPRVTEFKRNMYRDNPLRREANSE